MKQRAKKEKNYAKKAIRMLIAAGALGLLLALLLILRTNTAVSEWMAANFSRTWIKVFSHITGVLPFSLYETFLYVAILSIIALIVTAIVFFCKKQKARAVTFLLIILLMGLSFGDVYTMSAGFAYNRSDPDLPYYASHRLSESQKDEVIAAAEFMIADFNELANRMERDGEGRTISPYTHRELAELLINEYKRLDSDYFSEYTPLAKTITSKNIMTNMHITGVFFAPFGEANVNPLTPASDMPVTMAHELAHSKGAMREDDANLVAYWLTVTSEDPYLRYSGYKACYYRLIQVVSFYDSERGDELYASIDEKVRTEQALNNDFWLSYTLFEKITEAFNDFYLKLQGQKEGTGSYYEPTIPPDITITPGPSGGDDDVIVEKFYNLNNVQRMLLKAVEDRMNNA